MWQAPSLRSLRSIGIPITFCSVGQPRERPAVRCELSPAHAASLRCEGNALVEQIKERFDAMPANASVKKGASMQLNGISTSIPNWWTFLENVLKYGRPNQDGPDKFSLQVYGLRDKIEETAIKIISPHREPTFFGSYQPPDNLDGQMIDLVATHTPATAMSLEVLPAECSLQGNFASYSEVQKLQALKCSTGVLSCIGVLSKQVGAIPDRTGLCFHMAITDRGTQRDVVKSEEEKIVLSDHMPICFEATVAAQGNLAHREEEHKFKIVSMNMLAHAYMQFGFWDSMPQEAHLREVWTLACRLRWAIDRKTKWLPTEYATLDRLNITDKELANMPESAEILWERLHRNCWRWIKTVETLGFKSQIQANVMASDEVRLAALAHLLAACKDQPDIVLLQEVGLAKLTAKEYFGSANDCDSTRVVSQDFANNVLEVYPQLQPLFDHYSVVNASPAINVRRGGVPRFIDNGLILVRKQLLEKYDFVPITRTLTEENDDLVKLCKANAGKPIVGSCIQDKNGNKLTNIFGVHFDKGKTEQNLKQLVHIADVLSPSTPTLVAGDFNAVLRSNVQR